MNQETEQIFSSTGNPGVTRRQDNRIYINPEQYSDNPEGVSTLTRLAGIVERNHQRVSRGVFRGAVSDTVLQTIHQNGLRDRLEVAFPLSEFTQDDDNSWLIYWAYNHKSRSQIVPTPTMISETTEYRESGLSPLERIQRVHERGYRFVDSISDDQVDQIYSLWGPTFGWDRSQVEALQCKLEAAQLEDSFKRSVWFTAIRDNGTIISLAMAERLGVTTQNAKIASIENTEWRTRDEYIGQGLMTATLTMLNAQVISDLRDVKKEQSLTPLIYAECNFQSRSDRAGHGAGFTIPSREHASQIMVQNVGVGDNQVVPEGKLRDFTYMYVPVSTMQKDYDPIQVGTMIRTLDHS